jgi:hypothetical protein
VRATVASVECEKSQDEPHAEISNAAHISIIRSGLLWSDFGPKRDCAGA